MRTFLLVILFITGLFAVGIYYVYKNISYQPEWYNNTEIRGFEERLADAGKMKSRIKHKLLNQGSTAISSDDLSVIIYEYLEKETTADLKEIIKAIHSSVDEEHLSIEMVVDLSKISRDNISGSAESLFDKIVSSTPDSVLQNLFVKIDGKPFISGGKIGLGDEAAIYIGKMKFDLSDEIDEKSGRNLIKRYLPEEFMNVSEIKLAKGHIILRK